MNQALAAVDVMAVWWLQVDLTKGHKPGATHERERIEQANGWITEEKYGILLLPCLFRHTV